MESIHVTDEVLQAFLLNELQDDTVATHLGGCSNCREKLEKYRQMVVGIPQIAPETFSFDVTTLVMNNILLYDKRKRKMQALFFWGVLVLLLLVISSFSIPFMPAVLAIFHSKSIFTTLLLIETGLVVLLFLFADIARQYKMKEEKILKNKWQPIL